MSASVRAGTAGLTGTTYSPPSNAVVIAPGANIQAVVNAHPAGTAFLLSAGTYTGQTISPQSGDSFYGSQTGQTILNGAGAQHAFQGQGISNVTLSGLEMTNYAPPASGTGVLGGGSSAVNWIVQACTITGTTIGVGIMLGDGMIVRDCSIYGNQNAGISSWQASGAVVENNNIYGNNTIGQSPYTATSGNAGVKITQSTNIQILNNAIHDNNSAPGVWLDSGSSGTVINGNQITGNGGPGIIDEIDYGSTISNNVIENNNNPALGNYGGGGIYIQNSSNANVYDNTLSGNAGGGVWVYQSDRGTGLQGPYVVSNDSVSNNTIQMSAGQSGYGGTVTASGVKFSDNNYYISGSAQLAANGSAPSVAQWQASGEDTSASGSKFSSASSISSPSPAITGLTAATDTGHSASDGITTDATPTVTGTATAATSITLYDSSGVVLGTATTAASGVWSVSLKSALADGSHTLTATAGNAQGQVSAASTGYALVIDTKSPTVATLVSSMASGSTLMTGQTDTLTLGASAALYVSGSPTLTLSDGGTATFDAAKSSATSLQFDYAAVAGQTAANLLVTGLALNGGSIADTAGNALTAAGLSSLSGAQTGVLVNPVTVPSATVVLGSGSDVIALKVSEDYYLANAQFTVSVDGHQVGGINTATASHSAGQSQTFDVKGNFGPATHTVAVNFLNDAYAGSPTTDRNLYVTGTSVDGTTTANGAMTLMSGGPVSERVGTPIAMGSGSDVVALDLSEDYYLGNAQFTVSVDGKQVGGINTVTASHGAGQDQRFDVDGSFGLGQHTVSVDFLNDAYAGSPSTDRNLYVNDASYDGKSTPASLTLMSAGSQSFGVVSATTFNPGAAGGTVTTVGADVVNAGSGALTVKANGPSVTVNGSSGAMQFIGSSGVDSVIGKAGSVTLAGNADTLSFTAGSGNASITAGSGKELLNILSGSAGGQITISDFRSGLDTVHLSGYTGTGFRTETTSGGSTQITLTDNTRISLVGVTSLSNQSIFS